MGNDVRSEAVKPSLIADVERVEDVFLTRGDRPPCSCEVCESLRRVCTAARQGGSCP